MVGGATICSCFLSVTAVTVGTIALTGLIDAVFRVTTKRYRHSMYPVMTVTALVHALELCSMGRCLLGGLLGWGFGAIEGAQWGGGYWQPSLR